MSSAFSMGELENLLGLRIRFSLQNDPRRISNAMHAGTSIDPKSGLGRQFETLAKSMTGRKPGEAVGPRKRRFIEYFAIVPSMNQADREKRH
jgi:hypothetical protein